LFNKHTILNQGYHVCCELCVKENCWISVGNTVKPRFVVFVRGLKKKRWIRENYRCGSLYKINKNDQICLQVFTKSKNVTQIMLLLLLSNSLCILFKKVINPSSGILNAKKHLYLLLWHDEYRRHCHLMG
jgi:hypothetical protein